MNTEIQTNATVFHCAEQRQYAKTYTDIVIMFTLFTYKALSIIDFPDKSRVCRC